jgi:chondroitin AC lyase
MSSTKTLGLESAPGQREENFFGGSGINFVFRTGDEYGDQNFFDVFNYKQWPGVTAQQDNDPLPTVHWGEGAQGGNAFAGGVSDGNYGASAFIHQKLDVIARKGWFYFDNEFVALGSGITQSNGTASVYTTLNQTIQSGTIQYSKNNAVQNVSGLATVANPSWILQNGIGYVNLDQSSTYKIRSDSRSPFSSSIFTASIDHGTNPSNASYAFVVYPNATSTTLTSYASNLPLKILSNTTLVQSIYHSGLKMTQAVFYSSGNLVLANGRTISVNRACVLLLKESGSDIILSIANPLCGTNNPATLTVTINQQLTGEGATFITGKSSLVFNLPLGDYAGQSVTKTFKGPILSINNIQISEKLKMFPNPTTGILKLSETVDKVELTDLVGRTNTFENKSNSIDVSDLAEGIYFVRAYQQNSKKGLFLEGKIVIKK